MNIDTTHFDEQVGKLGRPFRMVFAQRGKHKKWINRVLKYDWYYVFKYYDDKSLFALHEDYNGRIFEKLNDKEVKKILL
ncbi:hypothetical protein [Seonamhaeicola sp.]|uniref:hypothetical protein n=1 Tax=Seonamhaeicola sp. TaxID=1912245 RepID=UPI003566C4DA